uniref:BCD1 alpha/beta domain-containing protein n=1 Tax=Ciona savignyi TaxID=51511 RepID=H2Z9U4_CIOSA
MNEPTTLPYPKSKGMRLQMQKASSMNIQLRLMPQNFTKRKENTTYYCFRRKSFLWHVEWLFYNTNVIEVDTRLPDQTPLRNAVTKYISTEESLDTFNPKLHEFSNESQLLFYLKNEVTPANITEYFKLNGGTGLRENLRGKTVIEFPRVIIVRPKDAATFESNLSTPCNDVRTRCSDGLQN